MNSDIFEGKWDQFKGQIRQHYGELTDDELETAKGNKEELIGKIKQRYGETREDVETAVNKIAAKLN